MSFLYGDDYRALRDLLLAPLTDQALRAFIAAEPEVADKIGLRGSAAQSWRERLANYVGQKLRQRVSIRKELRPDIGSVYHLAIDGRSKRVVLLADGLVVNFFARHEKGVKTEYIDPIVTMQILSLVKLSAAPLDPGLYKMDALLRPEDLHTCWAAIDSYCRPLTLRA
jgi:hypothetical protein